VAERRLVRAAGGAEFYVEMTDAGGPAAIRGDGIFSFDGVRSTVEAIATELAQVWDKVKPSEATVEFGLNLTAKSGKLTGLVVEGGGEASLKITLTWTHSADAVAAEHGRANGDSGIKGLAAGADGTASAEPGTRTEPGGPGGSGDAG
jgi:hypothetical protein